MPDLYSHRQKMQDKELEHEKEDCQTFGRNACIANERHNNTFRQRFGKFGLAPQCLPMKRYKGVGKGAYPSKKDKDKLCKIQSTLFELFSCIQVPSSASDAFLSSDDFPVVYRSASILAAASRIASRTCS